MDAGRELDVLVAENVMGIQAKHTSFGHPYFVDEVTLRTPIPHYSTDIAAAWLVVEKLTETYRVSVHHYPHVNHWWQCTLDIRDGKLRFPIEMAHDGDAYANAPTAPLAICIAALRAVGVTIDPPPTVHNGSV